MSNLDLLKQDMKAAEAKPQPQPVPAHVPVEQREAWQQLSEVLDRWRIRSNTSMPATRHLLEYEGVKLFPRGDLIALSGKEKCGKTTSCRMMVSAVLQGQYMGFRALERQVRVLWIDTEQHQYSTRTITRCIDTMCQRCVSDDEFSIFNLRGREELTDLETMQLSLDVMFDRICPDLVIIDGIRDYISDFNDVEQSAQIVLKCMALANGVTEEEAQRTGLHPRKPSCIVCVLHQNKPKDDQNMMGHLGATLAKKAGELWTCSRDDDRVFYLEQNRSRTRELEQKISYRIVTNAYPFDGEELGIPVPFTPSAESAEAPAAGYAPQPSFAPASHSALFTLEEFEAKHDIRTCFEQLLVPVGKMRASVLEREFCDTFTIARRLYEEIRQIALRSQIIERIEHTPREIYYVMYGDKTDQPSLDFEG